MSDIYTSTGLSILFFILTLYAVVVSDFFQPEKPEKFSQPFWS